MNTDAILERLYIVREERSMLKRYGWGETPGLDAEIAQLEALLRS